MNIKLRDLMCWMSALFTIVLIVGYGIGTPEQGEKVGDKMTPIEITHPIVPDLNIETSYCWDGYDKPRLAYDFGARPTFSYQTSLRQIRIWLFSRPLYSVNTAIRDVHFSNTITQPHKLYEYRTFIIYNIIESQHCKNTS